MPKRKAGKKAKDANALPEKKAKRMSKAKLLRLREEKERESLADAVVSLLLEKKFVDPKTDAKKTPPALYLANERTSPRAAPRAVWNATLRGDEDRLAGLLKLHRQVRTERDEAASEEQVRFVQELEQEELSNEDMKRELMARGLKWVPTITCPTDPSGRDGRNAFIAALQLGHVGCAEMLMSGFGVGRIGSDLAAIVRTSEEEIPLASLEYLFESGQDWMTDPNDVARKMAVAALYRGECNLLRRLLRFLLGHPLKLQDEQGFVALNEVIRKANINKAQTQNNLTEKRVVAMDVDDESSEEISAAYKAASKIQEGLCVLHLAALEATNTGNVVAAAGVRGLCEDTVNAPALGKYVTPMHLSALNPNIDIFKHLLECGGDLTISTDDNYFPLTIAAAAWDGTDREVTSESNEFEGVVCPNPVVRFLLENPSEELENEMQYYIKENRRTMIPNALSARRLHTMAWLLFYFDEDVAKRFYAFRAESLLFAAAAAIDDVRFIKMLTLHSAFRSELRSETCTVEGSQLLSAAIRSGCFRIVRALLAGELSLKKTLPPVEIEGLDDIIGKREKDPLVSLEFGLDHLESAMRSGHIDFSEELIQTHHVKLDVRAVDASVPILHVALGRDDVDFVELFLRNGASPRSRSISGTPAIIHAVEAGSLACVDLLLGAGVSLDLEKEDELFAKEEKERKKDQPDDTDTFVESPFEGWFIVLTGVFSVSKSLIQSVVEANGGKVQNAVNGKTTHCCYSGVDGVNDYGQNMGKGDKKYKESKRRKLPFIDESTITRYLHNTNQQVARLAGAQEPTVEIKTPIIFTVIDKCAGGGCCGFVPLLKVLEFLLERGADHHQLNEKGQNLLTCAIERLNPTHASDVAAMDYVLGIIGAEKIDEYDETGMTPLLAATAACKWEFVRLILATGNANANAFVKDPVVPPEKPYIKEEDQGEESEKKHDKYNKLFGWNCFHLLVRHGQYDLFVLAVDRTKEKADLNARTKTDDETPLVLLSCRSFDICKFLLCDASVDVCAQSALGKNLMHVVFDGTTVGTLAKSEGGKERPQDRYNIPAGGVGFGGSQSSCHDRFSYGHSDMGQVAIQSLINFKRWRSSAYHSNLSATDSDGMTPLHYCARAVQGTACVRMLLSDRPDLLECKNSIGNTPLACALLASRDHVATYLLEHEANLNGSVFSVEERTVINPGDELRKSKQVKDVSMYEYAMKHDLVGVVFAMLQHKKCDLNAALAASIGGANLHWTEHLLNALDLRDGDFAAHLIQLLFKCSRTPDAKARSQLLSLVKRLSPHCRDCGPKTDGDGNTFLHHFVANRHEVDSLLPLLDALGLKMVLAALLHKNNCGHNPVHLCVRLRQVRLLRLLLDFDGAEKAALTPDNLGNTPLHLLLSFNSQGVAVDSDVLSMLVACGCDLLACNHAGECAVSALGQLPDFQCERLASSLPKGTLEGDDIHAKFSAIRRKRDSDASASAAKRNRARGTYAKSLVAIKRLWASMEANRKRAGEIEDERQRTLAKFGRLAIPVHQRCSGHQNYEVYVSDHGDVYDTLVQMLAKRWAHQAFHEHTGFESRVVFLASEHRKTEPTLSGRPPARPSQASKPPSQSIGTFATEWRVVYAKAWQQYAQFWRRNCR